VKPARPGDSFSERLVGDLFDRDGNASQDVFECVASSKASAVHDPSSDVVESAVHHAVIESGHQQLRMPEAMSQADRVRESRPRFAVAIVRVILMRRVAAPAIRGHQDHLPSVLKDGVDGPTIQLVVRRVRATDVAIAAGRSWERAHPGRVVLGS
jgi:hypothetical protein